MIGGGVVARFLFSPAGAIAAGATAVLLGVLLIGSSLKVHGLQGNLAKAEAFRNQARTDLGACRSSLQGANDALVEQAKAVTDLKAQSQADTAAAERLASAALKSAQGKLDHAATIMAAKGSTCEDADALILNSLGDAR